MESKHICNVCETQITEFNYIGLNKKLLGRNIEKYFCLGCLANFLGVTTQELENKIQDFIQQDCALFRKKEQTTKERLKELQSLPLEDKIRLTKERIREWYEYFKGGCYVSFSGGKDSTVLLNIARQLYPDIEGVFCDTGLEYPEIKEFVKTIQNITIIKPEIKFREIIERYGYPVVSKEVAQTIYECTGERKSLHRLKKLNNEYFDKNGKLSGYNMPQWKFLLNAPFKISHKCCDEMKKKPFKKYEKITGKKAILGNMADESFLRRSDWITYGCNAFGKSRQVSSPMSFWTEQDVLTYLRDYKVSYASIYGNIIEEYTNYKRKENKPTGKLKLTGKQRTGCVFCMFGCHLEKEPNRFQRMAKTHPTLYANCIKPISPNANSICSKCPKESCTACVGLGLGEVLDYIGVDYKPVTRSE